MYSYTCIKVVFFKYVQHFELTTVCTHDTLVLRYMHDYVCDDHSCDL